MSQGSGSPTVTSNRLDPMLEDTAMSPLPSLATSTEVIRSGTEVPAARKEKAAIQQMLNRKETGNQFCLFLSWGSGMV